MTLIASRFAGGGGGDDRPGDAGRDPHLCRGQSAQYGAGAVGSSRSGGAAFGPLVGGILLEHFYWGRCS